MMSAFLHHKNLLLDNGKVVSYRERERESMRDRERKKKEREIETERDM